MVLILNGSRCRRPSLRQPAPNQSRRPVPHRLRLHPGPRPEAAAAAHEAQQGDGGGHGRDTLRALPRVPEAVLHRLPASEEVGQGGGHALLDCVRTEAEQDL